MPATVQPPYVNSAGPWNNPMNLEFLDALTLEETCPKAEIVGGGVRFEVKSASKALTRHTQVHIPSLQPNPTRSHQPSIDNCYHHPPHH